MATTPRRIGIRQLKASLSESLRAVKAGRTLVVTDHGAPIARLIPDTGTVADRLEALRQSGHVDWSGRRLRRVTPEARVRGRRSVADLVSENRE
jgi:prevent-host-death family protein